MSDGSLHLDNLLKVIVSFAAATAAIYQAVRLYRSSTKMRNDYKDYQPGSALQLVYMSKLAFGTIVLSGIYMLAEFKWFYQDSGQRITDFDDAMWTMLETSILLFFASLCHHGKDMVAAKIKYSELKRQKIVIEGMIEAAGGFVWQKDDQGKYVFCDRDFCRFFFHLDDRCHVIGFTDVELLDLFREKNKIRHSFGELCMNTDEHAKEQNTKCRYIECGYIGDKLVVLDIIKTPLFDDYGNYTGVVGFAWERSSECENVFKDIEIFRSQGLIERLADGVYWVKEPIKECKWDKPFPQ